MTDPVERVEARPVEDDEHARPQEPHALSLRGDETAHPLLRAAIEQKLPIETFREILAEVRQERAYHAKMDFDGALAAFQQTCPPIPHNKTAKFLTKAGTRAQYTYADLGQVQKVAGPHLHKHGLSFTFRTEYERAGARVTAIVCCCIVRHKGGHQEEGVPFVNPVGDSKLRSAGQEVAASLTYAKRQSLLQAFGIATAEGDVDGVGDPKLEDPASISPAQAKTLREFLAQVPDEEPRLLRWSKVRQVEEIPRELYPQAAKILASKVRQKKAAQAPEDGAQ